MNDVKLYIYIRKLQFRNNRRGQSNCSIESIKSMKSHNTSETKIYSSDDSLIFKFDDDENYLNEPMKKIKSINLNSFVEHNQLNEYNQSNEYNQTNTNNLDYGQFCYLDH